MTMLASGNWLTTERIRRIAILLALGTAAMIGWQWLLGRGTLDAMARPIGTDFSGVYSAGRMVLEGRAAEAWDWGAHRAVQEALHAKPGVDFYGWHYPPPFLLVAATLAGLPYLAALALWQATTFGALLFLLTRIVPGRDTILLALAAPVTMVCLSHGHNGFLTATLLGGGLWLLERKPLAAGLLLGALLYKPQFALLIGPLLLVAGNWRAIGGAALSAGLLIAATLLLWGWPVWVAFLDSLALTQRVVLEAGSTGFWKMASPFAAARLWGASLALAYAVQAMATLGALAATLWLAWKSRPMLRNAAACAATIIATPYALDYDLTVVGVGIAFLVVDARDHGWRRWEKTALALVFVVPLFGRVAAQIALLPLNLLSALALLVIALLRASPSRRSHGASGR